MSKDWYTVDRHKIPGLNPIRTKVAGVGLVWCYYDRRAGGKVDPRPFIVAQQDRAAMVATLEATYALDTAAPVAAPAVAPVAVRETTRPLVAAEEIRPDSFKTLSEEWMRSTHWDELSESTKTGYRHSIRKILQPRFGNARARNITLTMVSDLHDDYRDKKGKANITLNALRNVLAYGILKADRFRLVENVAQKVDTYPRGKGRGDINWTDAQFRQFVAGGLRLYAQVRRVPVLRIVDIFKVFRRTALRPCDICRLEFGVHYDHKPDADGLRWIEIIPQKTRESSGEPATIPLHPTRDADAIEVLERRRKEAGGKGLIFPLSQAGAAWTQQQWNQDFREVFVFAGLAETPLRLYDLRSTKVNEMLDAGCGVNDIARVTGWTLAYAARTAENYRKRKFDRKSAARTARDVPMPERSAPATPAEPARPKLRVVK
jgi:hypothetical protein